MNPPKANNFDDIQFLIAAQKVFTCTKAARCQPKLQNPPAHDAFTRLLRREPPDTEALWEEARTLVEHEQGLLVVDDTTLDKPYSKNKGPARQAGLAMIFKLLEAAEQRNRGEGRRVIGGRSTRFFANTLSRSK